MVRLSVALVGSARSAPRLEQAFRSLMIATGLRPGCLGCYTWTDPDLTVHYQESWETEGQLRDRVRSDAFTPVLAVIEASEGPPRVAFEFVSQTRGLDFVEEVRHPSAPDHDAPQSRAATHDIHDGR